MPRIAAERCASNTNSRKDSDWCKGCGLFWVTHGYHRADCTLTPPPCPVCKYHLWVHGVHRDDCTEEARAKA